MDYQSRLNNILSKSGNKCCADCSGRNPRWASISLGVFVCIRCCGIHRSLGTHISKMKSTTLDKWTPQMLAIFEAIDNEIANTYWEANMPKNYNKPLENSTSHAVEMFLREKYDRKSWKSSGPDPVTMALQPKTAVKEVKKEEKRPVPNSIINTDLLNDSHGSQPVPKTHSLSNSVSTPAYSPLVKDNFPYFPSVPSNIPSQYKPIDPNPINQVGNSLSSYRNNDHFNPVNNINQYPQYPPPPQFVSAPIHPTSQPGHLNGSSSQAGFYNEEAEKNKKINQVLSMYGPQVTPPVVTNTGFKPLGAIAAQNFFNQNPRPQPPYPTF
jgi:Putative GTPase activating protein for Arf